MNLVAARTFIGWNATEWQAVAVAAGVVISLVFGSRQLKDARKVRLATARPFIVVEAVFDSFMINLCIRNAGNTIASAIRVQFHEPITSTIKEIEWEGALKQIGSLAPGRDIRFTLDSYPSRHEQSLPMVLTGTVSYDGLVEFRHGR